VATGTAWTVLLAAAETSSEGQKGPSARVLHGLGALAKPGAKCQTQAGLAGWPDFDPDFAEKPGLVEPYLSAIRVRRPFGTAYFLVTPLPETRNPLYHSMLRRITEFGGCTAGFRGARRARGSGRSLFQSRRGKQRRGQGAPRCV
jgi:hypothetical protein